MMDYQQDSAPALLQFKATNITLSFLWLLFEKYWFFEGQEDHSFS